MSERLTDWLTPLCRKERKIGLSFSLLSRSLERCPHSLSDLRRWLRLKLQCASVFKLMLCSEFSWDALFFRSSPRLEYAAAAAAAAPFMNCYENFINFSPPPHSLTACLLWPLCFCYFLSSAAFNQRQAWRTDWCARARLMNNWWPASFWPCNGPRLARVTVQNLLTLCS